MIVSEIQQSFPHSEEISSCIASRNKVSNETEAPSLEFPNTVDSAIGLQHAPGNFQG